MNKKRFLVQLLLLCALTAMHCPAWAQSQSPNMNEIRNWISSFARYQALAELCTGKPHPDVKTELAAHIDRLYPSKATDLKAFYDKRYARFQKIKKCPAREFNALEEQSETRLAALNAFAAAEETAAAARSPTSGGRTDTPKETGGGRTAGRTEVPAPSGDQASVDALYKQGMANFLSPHRAVVFFSEVIAQDASDIRGYRARAWAHLANNSPRDALADFEKVLTFDPNDSEAYRGRGWARLQLGEYQLARADFSESIARAYNPAEGYVGRGLASFFLGDLALARRDFRATMRYQPHFNDAEVYTRDGELLKTWAGVERAPESYDPRVRAAQRRDPRFNADVSTRLDDWARYRKAEVRVRQVLNSKPRDPDAWLALAVSSFRQVDDQPGLQVSGTVRREAKSAFNKAVEADPESTDIRLARAMFSATPGIGNDPELAIDDLTTALQLDPEDSEAYLRRALVRAVSDRPAELALAVDDCESAGRLRPEDKAVPELCQMLRGREAQAQIAQQRRAAYEKKFAEFETEAWLVIGAMLTAVFTANDYKTEICFDKEGIAREAVAARADGRCYE